MLTVDSDVSYTVASTTPVCFIVVDIIKFLFRLFIVVGNIAHCSYIYTVEKYPLYISSALIYPPSVMTQGIMVNFYWAPRA